MMNMHDCSVIPFVEGVTAISIFLLSLACFGLVLSIYREWKGH